jgi:hypothetical protein
MDKGCSGVRSGLLCLTSRIIRVLDSSGYLVVRVGGNHRGKMQACGMLVFGTSELAAVPGIMLDICVYWL